jgi:hypothetical protein
MDHRHQFTVSGSYSRRMTESHDGRYAFDDKLRKRLRVAFHEELDGGRQSAVLAWASFGATFGITRGVTHWIRTGHGPKSGGMSLGGRHFHHYNLGIVILAGLGALAIRGVERHVQRPGAAIAYGIGTGLIVDEAALLLDLEDVYWTPAGRTSVNLAVGIIGAGGLAIAGAPFWPSATREVKKSLPTRT